MGLDSGKYVVGYISHGSAQGFFSHLEKFFGVPSYQFVGRPLNPLRTHPALHTDLRPPYIVKEPEES